MATYSDFDYLAVETVKHNNHIASIGRRVSAVVSRRADKNKIIPCSQDFEIRSIAMVTN